MNNHNTPPLPPEIERLMAMLAHSASNGLVSEEDEPLGHIALEFFTNNWSECRDGLLTRTQRIRIWPEVPVAPRAFRFEIDTPYKRKRDCDETIELVPGPVRGKILYRGDMFINQDGPCLAVMIDRNLGYLHPNYDRESGFLCIGDLTNLPPGPLPLDRLLENHIYPIVTYQNRRPAHPADLEAARYFALDPAAMSGLEQVAPLY